MSKSNIDTAMVLAAGVGSRMLSTIDYPKSMIKLGNKSLIERIINHLYENGVNRFVINTHFKADILEAHIKNLDVFSKVEILFSREEELLETVGGIKNALPLLDAKEFFVVNTDVFWPSKFNSAIDQLREFWQEDKMEELLLLIKRENAIGYEGNGDFDLTLENQLQVTKDLKDYVYIGAQIIKASYFDDIKSGKIGFATVWVKKRQDNSILKDAYGIVFNGTWLHIGDPEAKKYAEEYFAQLKEEY